MKNTIRAGKKLFCLILALTLFITVFSKPEQVAATWDTGRGRVSVWHLDSDYVNGTFGFNIKIKYDKYDNSVNYGIYIKNIKLVNSAGKTVTTWKSKTVLSKGGTTKERFYLDFSKYPSGTYKFCYTLEPVYGYTSQSYSISVTHSAGKVTYSSGKYIYDTNGNKKIKVVFNLRQLKGYTPKLQIYDSNGNLIKTLTGSDKVTYDNSNYSFTWIMENSNGSPIRAGKYTFKLTCNGKSCCKKLTLDPN